MIDGVVLTCDLITVCLLVVCGCEYVLLILNYFIRLLIKLIWIPIKNIAVHQEGGRFGQKHTKKISKIFINFFKLTSKVSVKKLTTLEVSLKKL